MFNIYVFDDQLQYKEAEGSSHRDGSYAEAPGTPKVSAPIFFLLIMELDVCVHVCILCLCIRIL